MFNQALGSLQNAEGCSHKDLLHELLEALRVALRVHSRYGTAIVKD